MAVPRQRIEDHPVGDVEARGRGSKRDGGQNEDEFHAIFDDELLTGAQ